MKDEKRVSLVRFKNRFFAKFHPKVVSGEVPATQIENDFLQNVDFHGQIYGNTENFIFWEQFEDFMFCLSSVEENENKFLIFVVDCFRLSEYYGIYSEGIPEERKSHPLGPVQVHSESPFGREEGTSWVESSRKGRRQHERNTMRERSRMDHSQVENVSNNIYNVQGREKEKTRKNFYDEKEADVNIYQSTPTRSRRRNQSRNFNIISGKEEQTQSQIETRSRKNDIRRNFYDQEHSRKEKRRDISQKRRIDHERRMNTSRSRMRSKRSITPSRVSKV